MTHVEPSQAPVPRPWGYWATLGWTLLAGAASAVISVVVLRAFFPNVVGSSTAALLSDMRAFSVVAIASVAAEVAVLVLAARLRGWRAAAYFGLVMPRRREAFIAFAVIVIFVPAYDLLTWLLNQDVVTPFQIDAYRNARNGGALVLMWLALVIAAPIGEEIVFRGFLVRGWAMKPHDVILGNILIAGLWSILHTQYDWFGVLQIFILGLVLGWVRWRSGSALLTMALHMLINAWATLQTIAKLEWLSPV